MCTTLDKIWYYLLENSIVLHLCAGSGIKQLISYFWGNLIVLKKLYNKAEIIFSEPSLLDVAVSLATVIEPSR